MFGRPGVRGPAGSGAITDSFDRANSAVTLGSTDTGQAYTAHSGTWGTETNLAYLADIGGSGKEVASFESLLADCTVEVTLTTVGSGNNGLAVRLTDGSNYLKFYAAGGATYALDRIEAGSATNLSSQITAPQDGDVLKVVLLGTSVKCYVDDVLIIDATSSFNQSATRHGLAGDVDTSARWNDLSVTP